MEAKDILEGNKLICEFMEKTYRMWNERLLMVAEKEHEDELITSDYWHHCSYDSSWDWIMPVVDKIESVDGFRIVIQKNLVVCYGDGYFWNGGVTNDSKLMSVYWAVVEFIKWHNKQNNK